MPKAANAVLVTRDRRGERVMTPLWIDGLSTDLSLQISEGQTKRGVVRRPVRFQERFLRFTALYPAADRLRFERETGRINAHWAWLLSGNRVAPMELRYRPNAGRLSIDAGGARTYSGYIVEYAREYAWNDVLWRREFRMRLITDRAGGATLSRNRLGAPYVPHRGDIDEFGPSWYTAKDLRRLAKTSLQGDLVNDTGNSPDAKPGGSDGPGGRGGRT